VRAKEASLSRSSGHPRTMAESLRTSPSSKSYLLWISERTIVRILDTICHHKVSRPWGRKNRGDPSEGRSPDGSMGRRIESLGVDDGSSRGRSLGRRGLIISNPEVSPRPEAEVMCPGISLENAELASFFISPPCGSRTSPRADLLWYRL
jgi:hypothetical protein